MKKIKSYKEFSDMKGNFRGIINTLKWSEINYIETKKNGIRGNHYHKKTSELFFIIEGIIEVSVRKIKFSKFMKYKFKKGDIFIIEPMEIHIFKAIKYAKWINVLSKKIDDSNPDIHIPSKIGKL